MCLLSTGLKSLSLPQDNALQKYFESLADKSPLPIILYNVPPNTSIDMSANLVAKMAKHPNIIGLKDSGGDVSFVHFGGF